MASTYAVIPAPLSLSFVQGDDFTVTLYIEGDRSAYTFTAKLKRNESGTTTAFGASVGSYNAGTDETPVTLTLTDTVTAALSASAGGTVAPVSYEWDLQWLDGSSLVRTVAGGLLTVVAGVT